VNVPHRQARIEVDDVADMSVRVSGGKTEETGRLATS
jgi:hypothetical protein